MIRFILFLLLALGATGAELKVVSDTFKGDQAKGVAVFSGNVRMTKGSDELNASKVTIYTNKENKPTKYVAEGDASFYLVTEQRETYRGKAQTVVYLPNESEYQFYKNVDLIRLDDYRRIKGEKVVVNTTHGQASAESAKDEPVIMIFTVDDKKAPSKSGSK